MTIRITSDHGQLFGLKWWNSQTQVDLTASVWTSPCESFHFVQATRQDSASYWGGTRLGQGQELIYQGVRLFFALGIAPCMKVCGVCFFTREDRTAIKVASGGRMHLV
jgi:hypothetical protein